MSEIGRYPLFVSFEKSISIPDIQICLAELRPSVSGSIQTDVGICQIKASLEVVDPSLKKGRI